MCWWVRDLACRGAVGEGWSTGERRRLVVKGWLVRGRPVWTAGTCGRPGGGLLAAVRLLLLAAQARARAVRTAWPPPRAHRPPWCPPARPPARPPGLFYRPWLRTLTWLLFYAFSAFSFVMGAPPALPCPSPLPWVGWVRCSALSLVMGVPGACFSGQRAKAAALGGAGECARTQVARQVWAPARRRLACAEHARDHSSTPPPTTYHSRRFLRPL